MPGNSFGHVFRITTAGESHGPANVAIVDGVPAGSRLSEADLRPDLARRRPGQSSRSPPSARRADDAEILSGVFGGTPPAPRSRDRDSQPRSTLARLLDRHRDSKSDPATPITPSTPSTVAATIAAVVASSARETNVRVAAGAVAKKLLRVAPRRRGRRLRAPGRLVIADAGAGTPRGSTSRRRRGEHRPLPGPTRGGG